ncbi:MAG: phosphodiester glycosidase family protein [Clostridia bacterium]|nr:phosphodiester glycosidase family protein [Clostridia bacterium]
MKSKFLTFFLPILVFCIGITAMTSFTLLDAFVFDRPIADGTVIRNPSFTYPKVTERDPVTASTTPVSTPVSTPDTIPSTPPPYGEGTDDPISGEAVITSAVPVTTEAPEIDYPIYGDLYYKDENIEITIEEDLYVNQNGVATKLFYVDLKLSDIEYLRTYFGTDWRGNVTKDTVADMAEANNAIFAINGDYFSYRERGYVIRNYELERWTPRRQNDPFGDDALLLMANGDFIMIDENDIAAESLPLDTYQCFTFGPRLIEYGEILVDGDDEVGQSAASNPRTAIGVIANLHYKIVVSEGRLEDGDGLTLLELAEIMDSLGCTSAYNLDGGSSTTLYFNGEVLNALPKDKEREVSDCIFINGFTYSEEGGQQ